MTEKQWLKSSDLLALVQFLADRASDRRHRLFACGCLRRVWDLLTVEATRRAVEVTEAFADGEATEADLRAADNPAAFAILNTEADLFRRAGERTRFTASALVAMSGARALVHAEGDFRETWRAAYAAEMSCADQGAQDWVVTRARPWGGKYWHSTDKAQVADRARLLRCIFGNPFRPVAADPRWLTADVLGLARAIYADRAFERLPILADALMDAGCADEPVLGHCRGPGPHARGCWVVDLVLGKE